MKRAKIIMSVCLTGAFLVGGMLFAAEHIKTSPPFLQEANSETSETTGGSIQKQKPTGENFKGYYFGAKLSDFENINKSRPNSVLIENDERKCDFYAPDTDIEIGEFTVSRGDFYLVFYRDQLVRIRLINNFRSGYDQDHRFFAAMREALTEKYGKVESSEPELSRFDGRYTWTTGKLRIVLTYTLLEYTWLDLEREMQKELFKKPVRITSTDL